MNRRQFACGLSAVFALRRVAMSKTGAEADGHWAAFAPQADPPARVPPQVASERWILRENPHWRWFERQNWADRQWRRTGITTPVNKMSGQRAGSRDGYLSEQLAPIEALQDLSSLAGDGELPNRFHYHWTPGAALANPFPDREADLEARQRHGRPPTDWLRSLETRQLRVWLRTIDVPEAGVAGMTFWTHLTRDHLFDERKIAGLTLDEQAMLHAAAHFGY